VVRKERLELSRLAALEPKSSASTNSATFAIDLRHKAKSIKRVLYLKFTHFDKQNQRRRHKFCACPVVVIDKHALQIARYRLTFKFNKVDLMQKTTNSNENIMLRAELELLMKERQNLLIIAGAAAGLIAELDTHDLPIRSVEAADLLATTINKLSEETLQDALSSVHASIEK
jgi:hypothetical protein